MSKNKNKQRLSQENISKQEVKKAFKGVLSVQNDPYGFVGFLRQHSFKESIRKNLCRVGGIKELDEMLFDPHVDAALSKRKAAIRGAKISFESEDQAEIDFVNQHLKKNIIDFILKNSWSSWFYGYSVSEIIWAMEKDVVFPDRLIKRSFISFKPDTDLKSVYYEKRFAKENNMIETEPATYGKYLLSVYDGEYDKPYGKGLAFCIYFVSKFKEMGWGYWGEWLEKYAGGFIKAAVDDEALDSEMVNKIKSELVKAKRGSALVYGSNTKVDIEYPSSSGDQFKIFRDSAIDDINISILGQNLTSKNSGGSLAATKVHESVQFEKIQMDMGLIEESIDRLIEYIYDLNLRDKANMPTSSVFFEKGLQKDRAERDLVLKNCGISFSKQYYMDKYGLKDEHIDVLPAESLVPPKKEKLSFEFSQESKNSIKQEASLDDITLFLHENSEHLVDVEDIFASIEMSKNRADLEKNLSQFLGKDSQVWEELLSKAMFYQYSKGAEVNNVN